MATTANTVVARLTKPREENIEPPIESEMVDRISLFQERLNRRRGIVKVVTLLLVVLAVSFIFSFGIVYHVYTVLDHKISALTVETTHNNITFFDNRSQPDDDDDDEVVEVVEDVTSNNIFNMSNFMTNITQKLVSINAQLNSQEEDIVHLHYLIDSALNITVAKLNSTIEGVQAEVNSQVKQVNENVSSQNSLMAYQFAGTFAILGSLISCWHITSHLRALDEPTVQRKIAAILWMIPIFSMTSFLGLVFVSAESYLGLIKDFYEAYCIYTFLSFLIAVLGRGDPESVIDLLATHANHLRPPIKFAFWKKKRVFESPRHKAEAVLVQCQFFAMQFVFVRPLTSIALLIADAFHVSRWEWRYPQLYITIIVNFSVFFAFTGLVKIYHAIRDELRWCHPFSKFLCIKGVVFMTFWQGVVISIIAQAVSRRREAEGIFDDDWSATEWSKRAQSFLICLEMFFFAIIHIFVFPAEEWEEDYREKDTMRKKVNKAKFGDNLALRDFFRDVKLVMKKSKKQKKRASRMKSLTSNGNETTFGDDRKDVELEVDIDWSRGWGRIEHYIDDLDIGNGSLEGDDDASEASTIKSDEGEKTAESPRNIV